MNPPDKVKIGPFIYEVRWHGRSDEDNVGAFGSCSNSDLIIRITNERKPQQTANTFLHEVLHAIHWVYNLKDKDGGEKYCELTTNGLMAFWQDNPEAMEWWVSLL